MTACEEEHLESIKKNLFRCRKRYTRAIQALRLWELYATCHEKDGDDDHDGNDKIFEQRETMYQAAASLRELVLTDSMANCDESEDYNESRIF